MTANPDINLTASRPFGVALEMGAGALDPKTVFAKVVVLTGEAATLNSRNGQWCFLNCLRLLARVVGELWVALPDDVPELQVEVQRLLPALWSQGHVTQVPHHQGSWQRAAAVLNVGPNVDASLPWTSIMANGWVARCTSDAHALPLECELANPMACMLAASMGVTEIFKRVYGVPLDVAPPVLDAAFSLFEMNSSYDGFGPPLPNEITIPSTLMLGAGAIGNGLALLASQLPLRGDMVLMDKQNFATENFGTCTLLDSASWIGKPKAHMLTQWLAGRSALRVEPMKSTIEDALAGEDLGRKKIDLVVNGLDDVEARRAVQRLWPRLAVDGAINSVGAAVVTHSLSKPELACLRCAYDSPSADLAATQSAMTGLSLETLSGDQNRVISDTDVASAREDARLWLREQQRQGRTICSTMQAAQAEGLGLRLQEDFSPSVPFVATASAALVLAQVLRNLLWPDERFVHIFQFPNIFAGPDLQTRVKRWASAGCECQRHRAVIDRLVAARPPSAYSHTGAR